MAETSEKGSSHDLVTLPQETRGHGAVSYSGCALLVVDGPDRGARFESEKDLVRVGCAADNDLILHDPLVSRYHLEIKKDRDGFSIADCGSKNGTLIGQARIKEAKLHGRTELIVGGTRILVEPRDQWIELEPSHDARSGDLVGDSLPMRRIFTLIERVAPTELSVLITGETGTGKELVARAIHAKSKRAEGPFVTLDCGALPPTLTESALFGHEKGAFTGADRPSMGIFERGHGGTLFLDEIGELPLDLQPKLLRAIERREIEKIGGQASIRVDVRILAATHRNLEEMVKTGSFRADLYYRLAVIQARLPALRERRGDIALLAREFFQRHRLDLERSGFHARRLGASALARLEQHSFPGNVRELMNILQHAAFYAVREEVTPDELPENLGEAAAVEPSPAEDDSNAAPNVSVPTEGISFRDARAKYLDAFERQYLIELLERYQHNVARAAREASLDRRQLYRLLEKYGISHRKA
jgi:DNA-binding NtrC family response regulator